MLRAPCDLKLRHMTPLDIPQDLLPSSQKRAIGFPALKKPNLDPSVCQNYRPISNFSFLSKTLERLVSFQLLPYLEHSGVLRGPSFYWSCSFITSLWHLLCCLLISWLSLTSPLSSTWSIMTCSYTILISFGLSGFPLRCFRFNLLGRSQVVRAVIVWIPQGSIDHVYCWNSLPFQFTPGEWSLICWRFSNFCSRPSSPAIYPYSLCCWSFLGPSPLNIL